VTAVCSSTWTAIPQGCACDTVQAYRPAGQPLRTAADLVEDGQTYTAARGGMGGRGNASYRSKPGRPAPRLSQPGEDGVRLSTSNTLLCCHTHLLGMGQLLCNL